MVRDWLTVYPAQLFARFLRRRCCRVGGREEEQRALFCVANAQPPSLHCRRWWAQFEYVSWPDKFMMTVAACLPGQANLTTRVTLARWTSLQVNARALLLERRHLSTSCKFTVGDRLDRRFSSYAQTLSDRSASRHEQAYDRRRVRSVYKRSRASRQMVRLRACANAS